MIYPDISIEKWFKRYPALNCELHFCECLDKADLQPCISKDIAGVTCNRCNKSRWIHISKEKIEFWNSVREFFGK
jgi:hypothetical protein